MAIFDKIVVISEYMKENLIQNMPSLREKITIVPRQVSVPDGEKVLKKGGKNVLYVGRFVKEKGVEHLIKAMDSSMRI